MARRKRVHYKDLRVGKIFYLVQVGVVSKVLVTKGRFLSKGGEPKIKLAHLDLDVEKAEKYGLENQIEKFEELGQVYEQECYVADRGIWSDPATCYKNEFNALFYTRKGAEAYVKDTQYQKRLNEKEFDDYMLEDLWPDPISEEEWYGEMHDEYFEEEVNEENYALPS